MPEKPPDFLDAAIAAAEEKQVIQIEMASIPLKIMGRDDRPAQLVLPKDISDMELISLMVAVAQVGDMLRAQRKPENGGLVVAHQVPKGPMQ